MKAILYWYSWAAESRSEGKAKMGSASLITPLKPSLCSTKSYLSSGSFLLTRVGSSDSSSTLRFMKKPSYSGKLLSACSVVCKAVSIEPQTDIEGLNIAEDVTQVCTSFWFFVGIMDWVSLNYVQIC